MVIYANSGQNKLPLKEKKIYNEKNILTKKNNNSKINKKYFNNSSKIVLQIFLESMIFIIFEAL